jgi:DNA-binding transcriptional MerR regulator
MSKSLSQITFEFFEDAQPEPPKEFLSQQPVQPQVPQKSTRGRKALKDLATEISSVNIPEDEVLFRKQYYSIGEVATMFSVNTSLIRYWENEFDILEPRKNRKGDRFFKPSDVKNLQLIYDLLRRRKFTIEGAKDYLKKEKKAKEKHEMIDSLQKLRSFLLELKASL